MLAQIGAVFRLLRAAVMAALFALWRNERAKAERLEDQADQADEYIDTRKRIDHAPNTGPDPDAARRWLRDRAKR